ncbi:MAG: DUF4105 domain-containing protein [Bacteroidota bacterium]
MILRCLTLTLLLTATSAAQPEASLPQLSPQAEVSLLTMLPGDEVYALYGHTAIRIADPALGLDRTYNYGNFDFDQPFFIARFARGLLDYELAVEEAQRTIDVYRFLERPIVAQRLALAPEARQRLFQLLEANSLPENRAYRYDFFFDNCSTRPRDILEAALGQPLDYGTYKPAAATFRDLVAPYDEAMPLTDLGINLGLAVPTDRTATPREAMFLPLELMRAFDTATLDGEPLVASTDTLFWVEGAGMPSAATDWPTGLAWILLALGGALSGAARGKNARPNLMRWFDVGLLGTVGLAGLILGWLWLGTEHAVTGPNWNLAWAWPTHLAVAVLIARRNRPRGLRVYWLLTAVATFGVIAFLPMLPQDFPPIVLPLGVLIVLRAALRSLERKPEPSPSL